MLAAPYSATATLSQSKYMTGFTLPLDPLVYCDPNHADAVPAISSGMRAFQAFVAYLLPNTGMAAPWITLAAGLERNKITRAISSGVGHFEKSAPGMAWRLAGVSMMLGRMELTRTPLPARSAASESISASAAALEAA